MNKLFAPIVPQQIPCKCCDGTAGIYGVVDFNKNCEIRTNPGVLPISGIPIYFHRCTSCGLIFTIAFDDFSREEFARHIYNESYKLVDPQYADIRPMSNAKMILQIFSQSANRSILDYGGGNGKLAEMLRAAGFLAAQTYDPFVTESATLPTKKFDLILSFEVAEHSPTPRQTFAEMASLMADSGMILFSTMTQPNNIDQMGVGWWYVAPRNGHVTLYAMLSLQKLGESVGLRYHALSAGAHVFYRKVPDFARQLFPPGAL